MVGKETALVDMGYRSSAEGIIRDLASKRYEVDYLLPTHIHLDHCGSCGTLAKKFPDAKIMVHPVGQKHLIDPSLLIKSVSDLFGNDLMKQFGMPEQIQSERVRIVNDQEQIDLGNGIGLRAIWTPGHASHHLSYLIESTGTLFTGDAVGAFFPEVPVLVPTSPPPSFNLEKTLSSLERIEKLNPRYLYTPHFGVLENPQRWLKENREVLNEWKTVIEDSLELGKSIELITKELTDTIAMKLSKTSEELPDHFKTSLKINVLGFARWLQYAP